MQNTVLKLVIHGQGTLGDRSRRIVVFHLNFYHSIKLTEVQITDYKETLKNISGNTLADIW